MIPSLYSLIAVDVQMDFCEEGNLAVEGGNNAAVKIAQFIRLREDQLKLKIATKDWHINPGSHFASNIDEEPNFIDTWPDHCVAGRAGAQFNIALNGVEWDKIFYKGMDKAAYSGFEGYGVNDHEGILTLDQYITNGRHTCMFDVVGIAFDYCVRATALDAARLGYRTRVIKNLTASVDPTNDINVIEELEDAGVDVVDYNFRTGRFV